MESLLGDGLQSSQVIIFCELYSLTAIVPYMAHRFSWASLELNYSSNLCSFATFDNSKCSLRLQLDQWSKVRVRASHAKVMSMGSLMGLEIVQLFFASLPCKSQVEVVFCQWFFSKSSTMAATGAIRRGHLPNDSIQWLCMKPWVHSIGRCTPRCTTVSAWPSILPTICLHFWLSAISLLATTIANDHVVVYIS